MRFTPRTNGASKIADPSSLPNETREGMEVSTPWRAAPMGKVSGDVVHISTPVISQAFQVPATPLPVVVHPCTYGPTDDPK